MRVSRREFITTASVSAGGALCLSAGEFLDIGSWAKANRGCVIIDLGSECLLRESLLGYQAALAAPDVHAIAFNDADVRGCRSLIVPGVGALSEATAQRVLRLLENGTQVLLESAAGFCDSSGFAAHQRIMREYFDVTIEPPIDLWSLQRCYDNAAHRLGEKSERFPRERVPYIDFVWPANLSVRDFSNVVPVGAKDSDVIAHAGSRPVAMRKRLAHGTLIFLGSPLGPGLRAGEPEAHRMLCLLISETLNLTA